MKKVCLFLILIVSFTVFVSCSHSEKAIFGYQNEAEKIEAVFETSQGLFKIEISYADSLGRIEIKEPENIAGLCFFEKDGAVFAASDSVEIPLSPSLAAKITPLFDAFRLSPENIASITKDESGRTVYTVSCENGVYTVVADGEAKPVSITFEGERTFSLTDIILQKNDLTSK